MSLGFLLWSVGCIFHGLKYLSTICTWFHLFSTCDVPSFIEDAEKWGGNTPCFEKFKCPRNFSDKNSNVAKRLNNFHSLHKTLRDIKDCETFIFLAVSCPIVKHKRWFMARRRQILLTYWKLTHWPRTIINRFQNFYTFFNFTLIDTHKTEINILLFLYERGVFNAFSVCRKCLFLLTILLFIAIDIPGSYYRYYRGYYGKWHCSKHGLCCSRVFFI